MCEEDGSKAGNTRRHDAVTASSVSAMFSVWSIIYLLALVAIGLLLTWLIIYSAVRAALTSHRRAMADDARRQVRGGVSEP